MSSDTEIARQTAIQVQQQRAQLEESSTDILLQNLMIDDSDLKRILKGEVQEPLNQLQEIIIECSTQQKISVEQAVKILGVLKTLNFRLSKFQKIVPYLILLSPLMRLTNIDEKEVRMLKRRVSIMIRRDMLDMDEEELELTDVNFYEALKIMCWNAIGDSLMGQKARIVTEQKKIIETRFTEPKKKGFRKFF